MDMLNAIKSVLADVSSVSPSSEKLNLLWVNAEQHSCTINCTKNQVTLNFSWNGLRTVKAHFPVLTS